MQPTDDSVSRQIIRPYYDSATFRTSDYSVIFQPDRGVVDAQGQTLASKLNLASMATSQGLPARSGAMENASLGLRADMEMSDLVDWAKWEALWTNLIIKSMEIYGKLFVQQPFEVTRFVMQVADLTYEQDEVDEDDDIEYFPEANPYSYDEDLKSSSLNDSNDPARQATTTLTRDSSMSGHVIHLKSLHTIDIMNAQLESEGFRALWKACNTNLVMYLMRITLESWFQGLFGALLGASWDQVWLPDLSSMGCIAGPRIPVSATLRSNWRTNWGVPLISTTLASVLLLPLDLIRTKLMVTVLSSKNQTRSLRQLIRGWSWHRDAANVPLEMWALSTVLSWTRCVRNTALQLISFRVTPHYHDLIRVFCDLSELLVRLPLETLLRRCQVSFLTRDCRIKCLRILPEHLALRPLEYSGVSSAFTSQGMPQRLWSGWRISALSLVCGYGVRLLNGIGNDLPQERF